MESPLKQEVSLDELRASVVEEFNKVHEKYRPKIFLFCKRILDDHHKAEDVTAETMIILWNNWADIKDQQQPGGFLFTTARNRCIDMLRKAQRQGGRPILIDDNLLFSECDREWEAAEVYDQYYNMVLTSQGILTEQQRDILYLRKTKGLSFKVIAKKMNLSHQTVYNRWKEIKNIMTNLFRKNGLPLLLILLTTLGIILKVFWTSV